ncbi:MAG: hypothetical protein OM95_05460 [Bdellovibrio sp. ArHS]|uniref:hypothetical protein n=1 Tax=Bdellovibrio sp. ArHS TaxID=1569284 RepID=UPI0005833836|nr:hypothetical protein [Bdellovibrio sp. ArHS]KHD88925.1 MAG: hypothetical protein OM95_05460 [Bdellovibrio sp. ArHS]
MFRRLVGFAMVLCSTWAFSAHAGPSCNSIFTLNEVQEVAESQSVLNTVAAIRKVRIELEAAHQDQRLHGLQQKVAEISQIAATAQEWALKFSQYWQIRPTGLYKVSSNKYVQGAANQVQSLSSLTWSLLSPLGVFETTGDKIFKKIEKNPRYELNSQEASHIDRIQLTEALERRRDFIEKHPKWAQLQRWTKNVTKAALIASSLLVANHDLQLAKNTVTVDQYATVLSKNQNQSQVDIIIDIGLFPHLAVSMDGKVYSYGVTDLSVTPLSRYLAKQQGDPSIVSARSLQVIRLNLNSDNRAQFKKDLEMSAYKEYTNVTFVNDCATMIARALQREAGLSVPRAINASPSQIGMYFSFLNTLGAQTTDHRPLVDSQYLVSVDGPNNKSFHLLRTSYYNLVESKYFILFAPSLQASKVGFDMLHDEAELQRWTPGALQAFENIKTAEEVSIKNSPELVLIKQRLSAMEGNFLRGLPLSAEEVQLKPVLERMTDRYFTREVSLAQAMNSPDNSLLETIKIEQRLNVLHKERRDIEHRLSLLK